MVNFNCHFDEVWNHLREKLLVMTMRDYLDLVIEMERLTHCGWHHSLGLGPRLYKCREWAELKQANMYTFIFLCS